MIHNSHHHLPIARALSRGYRTVDSIRGHLGHTSAAKVILAIRWLQRHGWLNTPGSGGHAQYHLLVPIDSIESECGELGQFRDEALVQAWGTRPAPIQEGAARRVQGAATCD